MKISRTRINYFGLTFIATGKVTGGKYFLCETVIPAGDLGPPMHVHSREDESFYLKKGKLKFIVKGEIIELNEGEVLNVEKGEEHAWENQSDVDAELIITFAPAGIEDMFIELENNPTDIKEIGLKYGTEFNI